MLNFKIIVLSILWTFVHYCLETAYKRFLSNSLKFQYFSKCYTWYVFSSLRHKTHKIIPNSKILGSWNFYVAEDCHTLLKYLFNSICSKKQRSKHLFHSVENKSFIHRIFFPITFRLNIKFSYLIFDSGFRSCFWRCAQIRLETIWIILNK